MDYSSPDSSVHRIFQAGVLEWVAISFCRGSFQPRDWTWVFFIIGRCFIVWATREVPPQLLLPMGHQRKDSEMVLARPVCWLLNLLIIESYPNSGLPFIPLWLSKQPTIFLLAQGCILVKAVYCHPACLTYMQSTSWETLGWWKHNLESRLPGEISITSDMQTTPSLWQKVKKN